MANTSLIVDSRKVLAGRQRTHKCTVICIWIFEASLAQLSDEGWWFKWQLGHEDT